jgi:PAS domain S-box-containing protein
MLDRRREDRRTCTGVGMAFGIIIYDQDRRILAVDDAAALLLGGRAEELVARKITDFVPQPDREHLAEARATFERYGEASGKYALERDDGSVVSNVYSVRADAPMAGLSLMALQASNEEIAADAGRVRRVGADVYAGHESDYEDRWAATGATAGAGRPRAATRPAADKGPGDLTAAVFPTEQDGWAALLAIQAAITGVEVALSAFDGGWPRDLRSVLAVRGANGHGDEIGEIIAGFGGGRMAGRTTV